MMSLKKILALTVLLSFTAYKIVHSERVYNVDLPRVDISAICGKWYMLASSITDDEFTCVTNNIIPKLPNGFTMNVVTKPNPSRPHPRTASWDHVAIFTATLRNDSNIIFSTYHDKAGPTMIIFDAVHDSHLCIYSTRIGETIPSEAGGLFTIFSRNKTLSSTVLERLQNSEFYQKAHTHFPGLHSIDASACE